MEYMEPQAIREYIWEEFKIMVSMDGTGPEEIFKQEYGDSKNFMTPETIGYGIISPVRNIVYELSRGTDLSDNIIFGVTVTDGETRYYDDSQGGFRTLKEAMEHIQHLIERTGGC
jgi:hypothetical protein